MALSLNDLKTIMAPLTELGRGEDTFDVDGLSITVRSLTPEEEIAIQRYARGALTEGDASDQINALDYLDRFRAGCLGHSIMQIGGMDFRGVSTIETGEKLPSGVAVKIRKHEAIMEAIGTWSRPMVVAVFNRFTSLMERIEANVEKSIRFDDDHIEAEITRLDEKLTELRATKGRRDVGDNDPRKAVIEVASNRAPKPQTEVEHSVPTETDPETWETARVNRSSEKEPMSVEVPGDVPKSLGTETPVSPKTDAPPPVAQSQRKPLFGDRPPVRESTVKADANDPLRDISSSLVDTSDPSVIDAENHRLMVDRARRVPPHVSAREVAQSIEQSGTKDGLPVFKMPVANLNREAQAPARNPPPVTRGNVNPNFRPAK